jgi:hypothetical protein
MRVHTVISQSNGVISVQLQALFVGDNTDATDKAKIAAFGDPEVNIAGTFTDPNNSAFTFQFPTTEMWVGVTTELSSQTVRFMTALPNTSNPNMPAPVQGPLDCITPNPSEAAQAWQDVLAGLGVSSRIGQAMQALRAQALLPSIPDVTI